MFASVFENGTLREDVIQCLSQRWPLTQKELYDFCSQNREVSYQAVHKALHELVLEHVVEKTSSGFRLNVDFARKITQFWSGVLGAYERKFPKSKVFLGRQVVPSAHKYYFGEHDLAVEAVPSVIISKATLHDLLAVIPEDHWDWLADRIAGRLYEFIRDRMLSDEEKRDVSKFLEKLNEDVSTFYWGWLHFNVDGYGLRLKSFSSSFTNEKERKFYDSVYVQFLRLLGYRLVRYDELSKYFFFERDEVFRSEKTRPAHALRA